MKTFLSFLFIVLLIQPVNKVLGQDFSNSWKGYFSYNSIVDISADASKIYAASSNAVFTYEDDTSTIEKFSTIEGLEGELISTNYYSENFQVHVIGYENGLIEILQENGDVLTEVDIVDKETIPPNQKRINHIMEYNGLAYISTDFGIVEYDLQNLEFGDTFFIGNGGAQIKINQTTVHNGFMYAATQNNAVKRAPADDPNLIDFSVWTSIGNAGLEWTGITSTTDKLFATTSNRRLFEINDTTFTQQQVYPNDITDLRFFNGFLMLTTEQQVFAYDANLVVQQQVNLVDVVDFDTNFTCALVLNNHFYIGTLGDGILKIAFQDVTLGTSIKPSGPLYNLMFSIATVPGEIWAVFGGYSQSYGLSGIPGVRKAGISHFQNDEWFNIPYDSIPNTDFLSHIAINPNDTNQVFISSYFDGVLEINNNEIGTLYDQTNSSLDAAFGAFNLSLNSTFDENGALWTLNGRVDKAINKFDNGQWTGYSLQSIIPNPTSPNLGFSSIVVDDAGNKYVGSYRFGVIGFNESGNQLANITEDNGNLPDDDVRSLAIDNNNNLWIGTLRGLRVLFNAPQLLEGSNPTSQPIIILEDGVPKELLFEQVITDIVVDGSNNKWVGTASSGVFYFSSDGQQTLQHFTKDNSPLPANDIFDIDIDNSTGEVYFATGKGLVSYISGGSNPSETLEDVFVYPNPVRPEYKILGFDDLKDINLGVKIKGLTGNVNIKITDVEGNLVAEGQTGRTQRFDNGLNLGIDGGTAIWNGKNFSGNIVATGVYLILISDLDSLEATVKKVMIVR